jgi:hypothetical protein
MRVDYDYKKKEWFVETPISMNPVMKLRVVNYLKETYLRRLKGEIGDRKKRMQEAISNLSTATLVERLVGNGEKTLYTDPSIKSLRQL